MISLEEMEQPRTIIEAIEYIRQIRTQADLNEKKLIRAKDGSYRKYLQEYIPLFFYALNSYNIYEEIKIAGNTNNDNFDGRILDKDNLEIEKIEISFPIEGERENKEANQLNANGISEVITFGQNEEDKYFDLIISKAKEKSVKDYHESTLIVSFNTWPYFSLDDIDDLKKIYELRDKLSTITFNAKKVVLFIQPCKSSEINTLGILLNVYQSET